MQVTERQEATLLKYMTVMDCTGRQFIFGRETKKFFKEARDIFHCVNVGFYAASATKEQKINNDNELLYLYVGDYQADKLVVVLAELTGKTFEELSNGKYIPPAKKPQSILSLPPFTPKRARTQRNSKKNEEKE